MIAQSCQNPHKYWIYADLRILWIYRNLSYFTVF